MSSHRCKNCLPLERRVSDLTAQIGKLLEADTEQRQAIVLALNTLVWYRDHYGTKWHRQPVPIPVLIQRLEAALGPDGLPGAMPDHPGGRPRRRAGVSA